MIKSCSKHLASFAYLAGKGRFMALSLFFVVFISLVGYFAINNIYTRKAVAAANTTVNFQARILTNTGSLVADGNYTIQFRVYDSLVGPTSQWNETQVIAVKNGYVSVQLGSNNPFGSSVDWSQEQWLTMNINGDGEMAPRMKITAVPLAFRAVKADSLTTTNGSIGADQLAQIAPGLVQSVNSANAALRLNQTGTGSILQLQGNGSDVLTLTKAGDLALASGLTVGNSSQTVAGTIRWNGTAFEGYNGYTWTPLGSTAAGSLVSIVKPSNEIVNNSIALQNDDHLTFPIGANEEWTYRFVIQANAATAADLRFAVTAPGGATCRVSFSDPEGAASVGQYGCGVSTVSIVGNGAVDLYEITGSVNNGATPGSVTLQWAQFTANASNTTVYAGSYVHAIRSIGAGTAGQVFVQNGNAFGIAAVLGTSDNNNLSLVTNASPRLTITSGGNIGIGDTTPAALFTVGTGDALQVNSSGNIQTTGTLSVGGLTVLGNNLVGSGSATGVTATTEPTPRINVTTVNLTTPAFANNDVIYINNAGQDYYARIISGGGTATITVSPAVSYDASAAVEKYNVQNIGATATDYTTLANRFFQGYFLGGVVIGAGSTTISDGNISSTTTLRLQQNGGALEVGGALNVAGAISGDGSGLTNIDGSQIAGGSILDTSLSGNVTLLGNTFNGVNQLVQLDGSGILPILNGSSLTNLNAGSVSSGTLADGRLSTNVTLLGNTFNGANQLLRLDSSGYLPVMNGSNLTSLNASSVSSGTLADLRLSSNVTLLGNTFNGVNQLLRLDGSGYLPTLNASNLTNLNASNVSSGTISDLRLSSNVTLLGNTFNGANQLLQLNGSGGLPALNGSALTTLNASNISSGTVADARLTGNVTLLGNTFNGVNQLVQLNGSGILPVLNGSNLTNLNGSSISSGTVADARLSSNVGLLNLSQTFTQQQTLAAGAVLGNDSVTPQAGVLTLHDVTATNNFTTNFSTLNLTANRNINLPDSSGTVCLNGSNTCGFTLFASGTAQIDSSTNTSIFINKTGATGNILTLQDNGTSVFTVANNGALSILSTNTAALAVRDAGGTDFFNVDTSGAIIRVGSATADGAATLLVLDTKNTAGDPSGVNGGMYYNSNEGKSRCYENGSWIDCTTLRLAGETTLGAANGTINVTLNGNYEYLECRIDVKSRSAAGMVYTRFNSNTGAAAYGWNAYGIVAAAVADWQDASDSEIQLTGTQTGTNPFSADLKITNFGDTNKTVDWTAAGIEAVGTNSNRYSGVGSFYNTSSQITSVQFLTSTGTFSAGSHAWCQGKNVR